MSSLNVERANRLIGLKNHPGWNELIRIGQELVQQATEIARDYPGWDPMQLMCLQSRAKAASEYHSLMIATVAKYIQEGVAEAMEFNANAQANKPHTIEEADDLRRAVLSHKEDDARVPGSY